MPRLKLFAPTVFFVIIILITLCLYYSDRGEFLLEEEVEIAPPVRTFKRNVEKVSKLDLNEKLKLIKEQEGEHASFNGIYVNEVFRITDDKIRFIYLQHKDNKVPVLAKVNKKWQETTSFCFNKTCEDILFCSIATRIGTIRLPSNTDYITTISLAAEGNEEYFNVPVIDVRLKNENYEHQVGVCLQPIFYFTDWTIVIQFFESWLSQGATKFFFYYHSYTHQTALVLDFYKSILGDNLELIPWSDVPVHQMDRGDYERDPNTRIFRHGATAFMHNCLLRARSHVKYIANFDLDDFPVASNGNIGKTLDDQTNSSIAAIKIEWPFAKQKLNWDTTNTPSDISFKLDEVKLVNVDNVRWDYRVSKKIFLRPERIVHFDMHSIYQTEIDSITQNQYTTIELSRDKGLYALHLRRFERHLMNTRIEADASYDNSRLKELDQQMIKSYAIKLNNNITFANHQMAPWAIEARETMRNLEQCRLEAFGTKLTGTNKLCQQSSAGCEQMLMANSEFKKATLTWIDLAHSANFGKYVFKA